MFTALDEIKGDGHPGLERCRGGLEVLEVPDLGDQPGAVTGRPDSGQETGHIGDRHASWLSHFEPLSGPLIAVHENRLSGTCDIKTPTDSTQASAQVARGGSPRFRARMPVTCALCGLMPVPGR